MSYPPLLALRRGLVYEGEVNFLRAQHPIPILTRARCAAIPVQEIANQAGMLFREESFDPVTRIRRGRMYAYANDQGRSLSLENVINYPFGPIVGADPAFQADCWYRPLTSAEISQANVHGDTQILLGDYGFQTSWRVVAIECIHTGDFLFTLRAISLFGVLPPLRDDIQTKDGNPVDPERVNEALEKLVDAFHVQQSTPVVDVSRETAKVILTAWIGPDAETKDLGNIVKSFLKDKELTNWAASIINRLHPRGKSAEQEAQASKGVDLRAVIAEDAELCMHLTGLLLREIGWAKS